MNSTKPKTLPLSQRGLNFEMLMWLFTRLSALAMYALVLTGFIGALLMGARTQMNLADIMRWAFMPNVSHVQNTNLQDLAPWMRPFWKVTGSALLLVAAAHGVHGVVVVLDDYLVRPRARQIVRIFSIVLLIAMSIIGLYVVWTS
jgi:succinate dehydrogenase hydrophobic anchor subunit